ncbi:MAG: hypothetical protein H0X33_13235 [Taibaiella sp.]|nr:hypothetical protein [Taibaiella sp.]
MARNLQVNLQLNTAQAQSAITQLQAQANNIGRSTGGRSGGGGSSGGGGGSSTNLLSDKAALIGAAALATAIAAVGSEFNKLGDRARELASTSANASSQLGQLRSSMERSSITQDVNATSPSIVGFQKFVSDISTNIGDAISHTLDSAPDRAKALKEKLAGGLGQGNEDWRRLKEQGKDLETDIGIARTAQQVKWQRTERDFNLSQRRFEVDTANQVFDLQKQAGRQQFDQTIAITKFQENFANNQATKAFNLSRQFAQQGFAISQGRATQDFSISQSDKTFDFKKSIADQNQDFAISQSRAMTGRKNQLFDMAMGGANGLQYLQASRDFNQSQQYAQQDKALNQSRETRDFGIGMGRDTRNFGISQQRAGQDFQQQTKEAFASRQLELESQEYARKYEGLELQTQINRQTQDLAISFQRLNQSIGFQKEGFANQRSDMAYDKNLDQVNFALQTGKQRRNFGYAEADFAGNARSKDPLGAAGLGSRDADFAAALAANARQSGQTDLLKQINDSVNQSNKSPGSQLGNTIHDFLDFAKDPSGHMTGRGEDLQTRFEQGKARYASEHPDEAAMAGYGNYGKNNSNGSSAPTVVVQTGGNTFNLDAGLTVTIQKYIDDQDKRNQDAILEMIKNFYGG